jgi:hypothetical protein
MNTIIRRLGVSALTIVTILSVTSLAYAQDLSRYRNFSFGMSLAEISMQIDAKPADVSAIHQRPALIQEVTWWPPQPYGTSRPAEPVGQVRFSFYNGALYRMLVTYDDAAIKGLTDEDMIRVVSTKYGTPTRPVAELTFPTAPSYHATEKVIARWDDSQYSANLFRSSSGTFAVLMFAKTVDAQAGVSIAESVKLEEQEAPQREADRTKKAADDLEGERQKNIKTLRP